MPLFSLAAVANTAKEGVSLFFDITGASTLHAPDVQSAETGAWLSAGSTDTVQGGRK